jgi:hypothetical protein
VIFVLVLVINASHPAFASHGSGSVSFPFVREFRLQAVFLSLSIFLFSVSLCVFSVSSV